MIYYPIPLHLQPAFKYLGYKKGDFPEAEKASKEVLSLPIYPEISKKEQGFIVKKIKEFYKA
jgi:dTDP-4-amino-4,6-dideoxygalactose transaminase